MLISANIRPKVLIEFQLIFTSDFSTFWGVARGKRGLRRKMKMCDIEREGVKNIVSVIDILFECPLVLAKVKVRHYWKNAHKVSKGMTCIRIYLHDLHKKLCCKAR